MTISRTLFRNGGSEYAINGENCRLLDVQELLSDTGLVARCTSSSAGAARQGPARHPGGPPRLHRGGRGHPQAPPPQGEDAPQARGDADEPHAVVRPRGGDPSPAQAARSPAEVARKAQSVAAVARDAKARILADDVVRLRRELHEHLEVETGRKSERIVLQERLERTRARQQQVEQSMVGDDVDRARTVVHRLESVQERLRGLSSLANQRLMFLAQQADAPQQGPTVTPERVQSVRDEADRLEARAEEMAAGSGTARHACRKRARRSTPSTSRSPRRPPWCRSTTSRRSDSGPRSTSPGRSGAPPWPTGSAGTRTGRGDRPRRPSGRGPGRHRKRPVRGCRRGGAHRGGRVHPRAAAGSAGDP